MEIFIYNAAKPREDIGTFNHRLYQYCADNNVIQAKAAVLGPSLVLSLTLMEDLNLPIANTLTVEVYQLDGTSDTLEEACTKILDELAERDTEDNPVMPFQSDVLPRPDLCVQGFLVLQLFTGTLTEDEENEEGDG